MGIPRPSKIVSAKEKANLRPNKKGRPKKTKESDDVKKLSRRLLSDPIYRINLIRRLREGTIQPGVENSLWYYAYGKPADKLETTSAPQDVRIIHEYLEEKKKPEPEPEEEKGEPEPRLQYRFPKK